MNNFFIPEHTIYQYLSEAGIKTPKYFFASTEDELSKAPFVAQEPVVIKGMAVDLWHKSDNGALYFCNFDVDAIQQKHRNMRQTVGEKFEWLGTLVTERVNIHECACLQLLW